MTVDVHAVVARAREVTGRSFASRDLVVLPRHGFTLVVLADDVMAYVAEDAEHRAQLAIERKVLARIAPRVSFTVPRPLGPIDLAGDIDLRVPAPGMTGPEHHARIVSDADLGARAGEWMGRALAELHASLGRTELESLGVSAVTAAAPDDVLVHGDFGTHNLAFDPASGMPTGVFDFHGARRGPRELDFALLRSYPEEVCRAAMTTYRAHERAVR